MDVLSEVLSGCRADSATTGRFTLHAPWSLESTGLQGAMFRIARGAPYWIQPEGMAPVRVPAGDLVVLPRGGRHTISSEPGLAPVPFAEVLAAHGMRERGEKPLVFTHGEGGTPTELFTTIVDYGPVGQNTVLRFLPGLIHLREDDVNLASCLAPTMRLFIEESLNRQPGWKLSAARMGDLLMVHVLRAYLLRHRDTEPNWLRGLADPKIAQAIMLMHRWPEKPWSLPSLADEVCMSRSRFSARFRELVGVSPISYLTARRMERAAERLRLGSVRLADVAELVGYGSEKIFARAFRRWAGVPPGEYGRRAG
ncbi:AraC family transcriptional regulator [Pigmentiphaga kullae]|uniref:AraC family transcriptional regulator n=1 Tax=Pigmentiphaga kullae TaxID=151784 RepID=A0A4Q7NH64_9BURK|nr:AraC family transcriptional regulator [Pigmentiphaga kullae]RZS84196.1 AraC family transcriptional regulator [Pigmentiphaga kullae]